MKAIWNNKVIAESDKTKGVEGNHYFPAESVNMEYLKDSDTQYNCPWKGEAKYYSLSIDGKELKDGAWSYPDAKEAAKEIRGYIAFDIAQGIQVSE